MGVPATTGQLRTNIADMEIGDYVKIGLNSSTGFWQVGYGTKESPLEGVPRGSWGTEMYYFAVKVDKGLLVGDRVIIHSWSWEVANSGKFIEGHTTFLTLFNGSKLEVTYRSLTGGVAFADANGNPTHQSSDYGMWPTSNEFDKYVLNFPVEKIQKGKTVNDVFHVAAVFTMTQSTPMDGIFVSTSNQTITANSGQRISRSKGLLNPQWYGFTTGSPSTAIPAIGFRPVFEYKEV